MATTIVLTEDERDSILATLSEEQRDFIDRELKRRRRYRFMEELAKRKGSGISDLMTDAEIEKLVEDWTLLDMRDAGSDWQKKQQLRCECGRVLRYQYVIRNNTTGEVFRLGAEHLEQHAKIDASTAKAISRGLELANLDTDERLFNVERGLKFEGQIHEALPDGFKLTAVIAEVVAVGLPLIKREIDQVMSALEEYRRRTLEARRRQEFDSLRSDNRSGFELFSSVPSKRSFIDDDEDDISGGGSKLSLSATAIVEINRLMREGMQSAMAMAEVLARTGYASKERYITLKYS